MLYPISPKTTVQLDLSVSVYFLRIPLSSQEQQSISIAKAGIVCSLPARTSILAAANPIKGHYNKGKTVSENLKLSAPLLSRFDLVFILLDKPDEEMDCMVSKHVMLLHAGQRG